MQFKHLTGSVSRLFGTSPEEPPAPADPVAALESAPQQLLAATALGGVDEALRAAAVRRLEDGEALRALARIRASASTGPVAAAATGLERVAQQRLAQLIDLGTLDFEALSASADHTPALLIVAGYCQDPALLPRALASIGDAGQMARLILDGPTSRIRQLAAESVSDPEEIRRLVKQLRGRDKSVYKIIREKHDALVAEEQRIEQTRRDAVAAYESLERHSHRVYDAIYEATLRHFLARWQALAAQAEPDTRERAARALARCESIIDEHRSRLALEAAQASEQAARQAAREQALQLAESESVRLRETAAREAEEAAARLEANEKARAEKSAAEAHALREIGALIGKAHAALHGGGTGRASGLRRALEEKLASVGFLPPALAHKVQGLDAALNELKDWKEHAAAPKRAALIEEMQALVGASLEPQALADRIRQLQDDWKTVSKGVASDSDADWQRFHQASQSAYQPCREYFEAQAKLRKDNAEKRKSVLERLGAFEAAQSGEQADFRAIAAVLREAPQEWRRHFPVERSVGRELQEHFDAAINRLQNRLDEWHAGNTEKKQLIIRRAAELLDLQDGREAAETIKRLQAQWKDIGAAARDQEQRLWTEFRGHCDAVFDKRQQAHADHTAGLQANKARAAALCEEIEQLAAGLGPALLEGAARLVEWRTAFETLGELPRDEERALKARFARAVERVQNALARERARKKQQSIADLLEAARRIHAWGWAAARAAPASELDALKAEAEAFVAGISHGPKGGAEALKAAWAGAGAAAGTGPAAGTDKDAAAREAALRLLCIRGELLTDRPTPAEDQVLRREHQLRRLADRMGQRSESADDTLESLTLEWVRAPSAEPAIYEGLLERFRRLLFAPG